MNAYDITVYMNKISQLTNMLGETNAHRSGVDSTKRALAIELLCGEADGEQTNRLARIALAIAKARFPEYPA